MARIALARRRTGDGLGDIPSQRSELAKTAAQAQRPRLIVPGQLRTGTQLARDYQAWALGLGRGFGEFGSLGGDVTQAVTRTPSGKRYTGHSLRAQYQKNFVRLSTCPWALSRALASAKS